MDADQLTEYFNDPSGSDAAGHIDSQTLSSVFIDHRQTLELLPVGTGIEHKVISPHLSHARCRQRAWAGARHASPWPLSRYLQAMQPPEPMRPIGTHRMTTSGEEHLNASIPVTRVL